jgi:hypothetical protein
LQKENEVCLISLTKTWHFPSMLKIEPFQILYNFQALRIRLGIMEKEVETAILQSVRMTMLPLS